jgi:hypothetical protein
MYIPTQFLPITIDKPKLTKRDKVRLERSESDPDSSKKAANSHVSLYEKREGKERRKRNVKPMFDTRAGKDRRNLEEKSSIDIRA